MSRPSDSFALLQFNMEHAHNVFKLGYDSILSSLDSPPTDDLANFLGYCEAWAESIGAHHASEEEVAFPFLNEKMDFSGEVAQHQVIHATLDKILAMIQDAKADCSKFDATELKTLMAGFKEVLLEHLDNEIEHVSAANIKAAQFTEPDVTDLNVRLEEYAKSHGDPTLILPFMTSHTPPDVKEIWPGFPWILRKVVVPYIIGMRHYGYWKYSPYPTS